MDVLRLINGLALPAMALGREAGGRSHPPPGKVNASARTASGSGDATESAAAAMSAKQSYMSPLRLRRLWPTGGGRQVPEKEREDTVIEEKGEGTAREEDAVVEEVAIERRRENWVLKILRVGSMWREREAEGEVMTEGDLESAADAGDRCVGCGCDEASEGCAVGDDEEETNTVFDRESFSRLLRKVSVMEAQFYAKMSYLGGLAYVIPKIKTRNLLKSYGLQFVTSSVEKKSKSLNSLEEQIADHEEPKVVSGLNDQEEVVKKRMKSVNGINAPAAYQVAASAATYLQYQAHDILPLGSSKMETKYSNKEFFEEKGFRIGSPEETSFVATTSSVTAVVSGKEEMKKAVVKDLNSANSSPCEWYICDDDKTTTRYFVIQGSETLASWQANLLFEPIQFEGLDVLVHRGIYEAAKGIYRQMLPEIKSHLTEHGESATLRFTGHSLGGSLALLVNLMLLIRGEAPAASLMPVVTFGAPSIMCGGDYLLRKLGLPKNHVQAITLHRDIVPRAFSCHYPDHVAKILKAVNGNFRNHPCLINQKFLYAPMGKLLILQPEDKYSPPHHLLPPGGGLYILGHPLADSDVSSRLLSEAQSAFLNSPHPLEILSDPSAYGSEGTVYRDHDMNSYLRSVRGVIRQELKLIRKAKREQRRNIWWPLVATQNVDTVAVIAPDTRMTKSNQHQFSFAGVLHGGRETFKRFKRLVTSQHMHMLVVLLFPARVFLLGAFSVVKLI